MKRTSVLFLFFTCWFSFWLEGLFYLVKNAMKYWETVWSWGLQRSQAVLSIQALLAYDCCRQWILSVFIDSPVWKDYAVAFAKRWRGQWQRSPCENHLLDTAWAPHHIPAAALLHVAALSNLVCITARTRLLRLFATIVMNSVLISPWLRLVVRVSSYLWAYLGPEWKAGFTTTK